jgi:2,3-bisphosphoglycerate-independent phosphoglycerate mutase
VGLLNLLGYNVARASRPPSFLKQYGLRACAFTDDPVHSKIVKDLDFHLRPGSPLPSVIEELPALLRDFDFFLLHYSGVEQQALTGDYYEKIKAIEAFDPFIPSLANLYPSVLAVTSDSSMPTILKSATWHPVPLIIHSAHCRFDTVQTFDEIACLPGGLGILNSQEVMPLLLANAGKCKPSTPKPVGGKK